MRFVTFYPLFVYLSIFFHLLAFRKAGMRAFDENHKNTTFETVKKDNYRRYLTSMGPGAKQMW